MKRHVLLACAVIALAASCAAPAATISFDEGLGPEEAAWIATPEEYSYEGAVTGYNGINVAWPAGEMIQIPAGDTVLEWKFTGRYSGEDVVFRYDFRPRKRYYFFVARRGREYGFHVYESGFDEGVSALTDEQNFRGFIPFGGSEEKHILPR